MKTSASLFTGGACFDLGAKAAGYTPVWGVEIEADIAACAKRNLPEMDIITADVADVDYSTLPKVDRLHASTVCKNASVASQGGEAAEDIKMAKATCRAVEVLQPETFTLENVWPYRDFDSFKFVIIPALRRNGYHLDWWHLNAANYGVPQTRKRLILIASKRHQPQRPTPTHSKTPDLFGLYKSWVGWYEAIEDLIPDLPECELAPWQKKLIPDELKNILIAQGGYGNEITSREADEPAFTITGNSNQGGLKALLVSAQNASHLTIRQNEGSSFCLTDASKGYPVAVLIPGGNPVKRLVYYPSEPSPTVVSKPNPIRLMVSDYDGKTTKLRNGNAPSLTVRGASNSPKIIVSTRIIKLTPRALARFQTIPDTYELPDTNGLACKIIGNAVPCLLAQRIMESL